MQETVSHTSNARRELGLLSVTSLVFNNMVGAGIFILPATLAMFGSISLLGWIFTGIGSMILAFIFSQLGQIKPLIGGPYAYCREGLGDFIGFQIAFCYWIAVLIAVAGMIIPGVAYLSVYFPLIASNKILALGLSVLVLWIITGINILGVRETKISLVITAVLKFIPLIAISIWGLFYSDFHNITASFNVSGKSNLAAISGAAMITLWAFAGFETATIPSEYIKNPKRTIPLGTLLGTLIAAILYIWVTFVVMSTVSNATLAKSATPFATTTKIIFGNWAVDIFAVIIAVSAFSSCIGWIMMQGQVSMAVARDKLFFKIFAKTNRKNIPVWGLLISSLLITAFMLLNLSERLIDQFNFLIELSTILFLIAYIYTVIASFFIFHKHYHKKTQQLALFALSGIGLLAFIYALWAIIGAGQKMVFYGCLTLFICGPLYVFIRRKEKTV